MDIAGGIGRQDVTLKDKWFVQGNDRDTEMMLACTQVSRASNSLMQDLRIILV